MSDGSENWLPVVGFEGLYEVSDCGRVRSLPRVTRIGGGKTRTLAGREIKTYRLKRCGHIVANLVPREGVAHIRKAYVHALVLEAFVGPRPPGFHACHNDGDAGNNHVSNLRWDTPSSNNMDLIRHGTHYYASRTECKYGHPLDGVFRKNGVVRQRYCKTCFNARAREKYHRQRAEKKAG